MDFCRRRGSVRCVRFDRINTYVPLCPTLSGFGRINTFDPVCAHISRHVLTCPICPTCRTRPSGCEGHTGGWEEDSVKKEPKSFVGPIFPHRGICVKRG